MVMATATAGTRMVRRRLSRALLRAMEATGMVTEATRTAVKVALAPS